MGLLERNAFRLFLACVGLLLLAWWDTAYHLWSLVWTVDAFSHGIWVPPVAAWLIYRKRQYLAATHMKAWWPAWGALVIFSGFWLLGEAAEARIIQHVALIASVNAVALGVMGPAAFRVIRFPILFLFLMIPMGEQLVAPLQVLTAKAVIGVLHISGIEFKADGVLIELSGGLYQVARACAGVKFFFTSMVMGILLCHLVLQSWKRRLVFLVAAALMPIVANIVRVYTTILIAEWSGQEFAKGVDHILYGWGFLSIILIILVAVAYRIADRPALEEVDFSARSEADSRDKIEYQSAICVVFPLAAAIWGYGFMAPSQSASLQCPAYRFSPDDCADCEVRRLGLPKDFADSRADQSVVWRYRLHANVIEGITEAYLPDRLGHRVQSAPFSFLGRDWAVLEGQRTQEQTVGNAIFSETIVWRNGDRKLVWRAYFVDGHFITSHSMMKVALATLRLKGKKATAQAIAIATDIQSDGDAARDVLHRFLSMVPPQSILWQQVPQGETDLCAV